MQASPARLQNHYGQEVRCQLDVCRRNWRLQQLNRLSGHLHPRRGHIASTLPSREPGESGPQRGTAPITVVSSGRENEGLSQIWRHSLLTGLLEWPTAVFGCAAAAWPNCDPLRTDLD